MFHRLTVRVSNLVASERFYGIVLPTLGVPKRHGDDWSAEWGEFLLAAADDAPPVTRNLHVGFTAPSHEHVDRFWRAGTAAGYQDDGAPGLRPEYSEDYYGAFLLDPDGNSAEAAHHKWLREPGKIDHVWIRVVDRAAAQLFYETVSPFTGFRFSSGGERARFDGAGNSFTLALGRPTEHAHLAFPAKDSATVDAFHLTAIQAGYRDHRGPGERRDYPGPCYAAGVLDPDGNSVEVVHCNR